MYNPLQKAHKPAAIHNRSAAENSKRGKALPVQQKQKRVSPTGNVAQPVIQRKLGFELEMLVLTDIAGRPAPDKALLGNYGNLDLVVDRSATVRAKTPVKGALAPIRRLQVPAEPPKKGMENVTVGRYDLPLNYESRKMPDQGFDPLSKPLSVPLMHLPLDVVNPPWQVKVLYSQIKQYRERASNWEIDLAVAALQKIITMAVKIGAKYPRVVIRPIPEPVKKESEEQELGGPRPDEQEPVLYQPEPRIFDVAQIVGDILPAARKDQDFWNRKSTRNFITNDLLHTETREKGTQDWGRQHPVSETMGGEFYDSIVEIVTKAYEPEEKEGSAALISDMAKAEELAGKIETGTSNFNTRVPLDSVGVSANRSTFIGATPGDMAQGTQETGASIQSTMAIDLKSLWGFFILAMNNLKGDRTFGIKHQSDDGHSLAQRVGMEAPNVAAKVLFDLQSRSLMPQHLVGLLTLAAQYLLMGDAFEQPGSPQLDKNAVSLLSRTDLAKIYKVNVPEAEKKLVEQNLVKIRTSLLTHSQRDGNSLLLRQAQGAKPMVTRALQCGTFIDNIFTQASDGFTPHLDEGIFKQMGPEAISRGTDPRTAPVFELRNLVPTGGNRFRKNQWVPFARDLVGLVAELNTKGFLK